jgi:hypothetical protein
LIRPCAGFRDTRGFDASGLKGRSGIGSQAEPAAFDGSVLLLS